MKTRWNVTLALGTMSVPDKIKNTRFIVQEMTGNVSFPSPSPSLVDLANKATLLETKQNEAETGNHQSVAEMHEVERELVNMLTDEAAYVAKVANANFASGESIIKSAGMKPKKERETAVKGFAVKPDGIGKVKVSTKSAGDRAAYQYQYTETPTDDDSWVTVEALQSKITVTGLRSTARVYFRVRVLIKDGFTDWSQVINTVIL